MNKNYAYLFIFLFIPFMFGCGSSQYMQGNRFYNNLGFGKAIPHYEKALEDQNIPDAKIKLADSYRRTNNSLKAEYWYSQVVAMPQSKPVHKLYYAQALLKNGKCEEAAKWFEAYAKENPSDQRPSVLKSSCLIQPVFKKDSAQYTINKVQIYSTGVSDFSPVYYKDGIVFVSERTKTGAEKFSDWTNRPFLDLYYAKIDQNDIIGSPQPLKGEVNSKYNEGPVAFNKEGTVMYFTRNNYENRKARKDNDGIVNLKIYKASFIGDEWKHIESLPFNNDLYSTGHPALSADGMTMYFISDKPGGMGGTDIYMAKQIDGRWSDPLPLGDVINTAGNEMFTLLYNDTVLYFASDGRPGMGGLDIFYSVKRGNEWTDPENVGYPVNSSRDDFGYIPDANGNMGFFSSNREGDGSIDHIYRFNKSERKIVLDGLVVEKISQEPVDGVLIEITIKDHPDKKIVYSGPAGKFNFELDPLLTYVITASKDGYLTHSKDISTMKSIGGDTLAVKLEIELIEIHKPIALENIYYDFDKWNIRADATHALDKLALMMNENPGIKVELSSHADARGTHDYNLSLTQKRAESVVNYLISKGISAERMIPRGYGETKPVNGCIDNVKCSEEMHQQNRRTEFTILEVQNTAFSK